MMIYKMLLAVRESAGTWREEIYAEGTSTKVRKGGAGGRRRDPERK
jgi:hypothetical protein